MALLYGIALHGMELHSRETSNLLNAWVTHYFALFWRRLLSELMLPPAQAWLRNVSTCTPEVDEWVDERVDEWADEWVDVSG